jgi:hypothetical protein
LIVWEYILFFIKLFYVICVRCVCGQRWFSGEGQSIAVASFVVDDCPFAVDWVGLLPHNAKRRLAAVDPVQAVA